MTTACTPAPAPAPAVTPDTHAFKSLVHSQGGRLAHGWNEHSGEIRAWLRPTSNNAMLDMVTIGPGAAVLDVSAGAYACATAASNLRPKHLMRRSR